MKTLVLWATPRSVSTAFERAFLNRPDTHTYHEPYGDAFYTRPGAGNTDLVNEGWAEKEHELANKRVMYPDITAQLQAPRPGKSVIFSKDHSYYMTASSEGLGVLKGFRNTFLIRKPKKAVASFWRMQKNDSSLTYFDPTEVGFKESYELFLYSRDVLKEDPVIVDADDLISNPRGVLVEYCKAVGIEFVEEMVSWKEQGEIKEWKKWDGWHTDAQNTTGFVEIKREEEVMPQDVMDLIAECEEKYYNPMYALRLIPKAA